MDDEEVKQVVTEENKETETPTDTKQEELPLVADDATGETKTEIETKAEETPKEEPKTEERKQLDWRDREIKNKHKQILDFRKREAELERELEAAKALAAKFNQSTPSQIETIPADEVEKRAQQLLAQQRYIEECNKTAQTGEKTYGASWKEAVSNLEVLGGFDPDTMNGLLATDDPAKVLFELGKNPDNYHRIMELPIPKRIVEMGKLAMQPTQVKKVSEAPPPVTPIGGRAAPGKEVLSDNLDDEKWFTLRRQQRLERMKAQGRIR